MDFRKRLFAILMSVAIVLTYMPALAFAGTDAAVNQDAKSTAEESSDTGKKVSEDADKAADAGQDASDKDAAGLDAADEAGRGTTAGPTSGEASQGTTAGPTSGDADKASANKANDADQASANKAGDADQATVSDADQATAGSTEEADSASAGSPKRVAAPVKADKTIVKTKNDLADSDELIQQFVDDRVAQEIASRDKSRKYSKSRQTRLTGNELRLYQALVPMIKSVAEGTESNTVFSIPVSDVYEMTSYTADDLSVDELFYYTGEDTEEGYEIWDATDEAKESLEEWKFIDYDAVVAALLADYPYDLYWYDKTIGIGISEPSYNMDFENESLYFTSEDTIDLDFYVSGDYSANATTTTRGDLNTTSTNTALTSAAATAASNIAETLTANKSKTDVEKLTAYKNAICDLTSYNDAAAADVSRHYGDPWQLIHVFDKDPSTKVVCEGYAKAFQYLCDNTIFQKAALDCYTVTGNMDGGTGAGGHMWNIMHMENGKNYMVDVTNSDTGTIGAPDKVFLKGYASGSMTNGYAFDCGDTDISYTYDDATLGQFGDAQLRLSKTDYAAGGQSQPQDTEGYEFIQDRSTVIDQTMYFDAQYPVTYVEDGKTVKGQYDITDMSIVSQESETDGDVIEAPVYDEDIDEWIIEPVGYGSAVVRVDYEKIDGTADYYTFKVTVTDEVFRVEIFNDDETDNVKILPGGVFRAGAYGERLYNEEASEEGSTYTDVRWQEYDQPDMYKWELTGTAAEYAEIEEDGKNATITMGNSEALMTLLENGPLDLGVKVSLVTGNTVLASSTLDLEVVTDYYTIETEEGEFPGLHLYKPETVNFKMCHYTGQDEPEVVSNAAFTITNLDEYEDILKVTKGSANGEFTFTEIQNEDIELSVKAETSDGESVEQSFYSEYDEEVFMNFADNYDKILYKGEDVKMTAYLPSFMYDGFYNIVVKAGDASSATAGSGVTCTPSYEEYVDDEGDTRYSCTAEVTISKAVLDAAGDSLDVSIEAVAGSGEYAGRTAFSNTEAFSVAESVVSYYGLPSQDYETLPGDSSWQDTGDAWINNSSYNGYKGYKVTDVVISDADKDIVEASYDDNSSTWNINAKKTGDATVTFTGYYDEDPADTFTYVTTWHIKNNVYTVSLSTDSSVDHNVAGSTVHLLAYPSHSSSGEGYEEENFEYQWQIIKGSEMADFVNEDGDTVLIPTGDNATVKFKDPGTVVADYNVQVKVMLLNNGLVVANSIMDLYYADEVIAAELPDFTGGDIPVGETVTYPIVSRLYNGQHPDGITINPADYGITYTVGNFYTDDADVSIVDGNKVEITRKTGEYFNFAIYTNTDGGTRSNYFDVQPVDNTEPLMSFDAYTSFIFDNQTLDLTLDMSGYEEKYGSSWADQRSLSYYIATEDPDSEGTIPNDALTEALTVSDEDPVHVSVDGAKIAEALGDSDDLTFYVFAEVRDSAAGPESEVLNSTNAGITLRKSQIDYKHTIDDQILATGDSASVSADGYALITDADHPDGATLPFQILDVTCPESDQTPDTEGESVVSVEEGTNSIGKVWNIIGLNPGTATVTVSYLDVNGNYADENDTPYTLTFDVEVRTDVYQVSFISSTDIFTGTPGSSIDLRAVIDHWGENYVDGEKFTCEWSLAEGDEGLATLETSGDESVKLTFGDLPGGEPGSYPFTVILEAYDENGTLVASGELGCTLTGDSYVITLDGLDTQMDVGDSSTVTAKIIHKHAGEMDTELEGTVNASSIDTDSLSVESVDGRENTFTVTRLTSDQTGIQAYADFVDESGNWGSASVRAEIPHKYYSASLDTESAAPKLYDYKTDNTVELALTGFENILENDAESLTFSVGADAVEEESGDVYGLDGVISGVEVTEDGKLLVTIDGDNIPTECEGENGVFPVNSIIFDVTAERSYGDGQTATLLTEDMTDQVEVVWTCKTLGHQWGETIYEWAEDYSTVKAFHVCQRENHYGENPGIEAETANTEYTVTTPAQCTEDGTGVYTVTFENTAFNEDEPVEGHTIKTVTIDAPGHAWDDGVPVEGKEGYALYTCSRCNETKEEADADAMAVIDAIRELPAAADISLSDGSAIGSARAAYDELSDAQKALIFASTLEKLTDAETAYAAAQAAAEQEAVDIAAAQDVTSKITGLPDSTEVTTADKAAIEAARAAYDNLTADQKALVSSETLDKLEAAEAALAEAEAAATDQDKADAVSAKITDLPAADDVTIDDKAAIETARAAYDALTPDQQALVDAGTLKKLTDAEAALAAAEEAAQQAAADQEAADTVTQSIADLPAADDVTIDNKAAIEAARAAYDALTDAQKALVSEDTLNKLTAAEQAIRDLEAATQHAVDQEMADEVSGSINSLPSASDVTVADKADIEAARAEYEALTDAQKALVTESTLKKLTDAEKALAAAEAAAQQAQADQAAADAVTQSIAGLPAADAVTLDNKAAIEAARAAFDALTDAQKALVDADTLKKLTDAEDALEAAAQQAQADQAAADTVTQSIAGLPAADAVTIDDKAAVEAARTAYDALTAAQKALVDADTLNKLTAAEQAIKDIEEAAAQQAQADQDAADTVTQSIADLPAASDVTVDDKADIEAARKAYDALTAAQKALVDADTLKKLTDAEDALEAAEAAAQQSAADQAAADAVIDKINALPASGSISTDDEEKIKQARAAYDALTDAQKALVGDDNLKDLTDAETGLEVTAATENAQAKAQKAETAATDAEKAVEALAIAAEAAADAAAKAAETLDPKDIADAQAKAAEAEKAQTAAQAAIDAADAAKKAADEAIKKAQETVDKAEAAGVDVGDANNAIQNAQDMADISDQMDATKNEKENQDAIVSDAAATTNKAASDKAAADKAVSDQKAAEAAKAAAAKAEADRKAAEYAANGNAIIDPTLPKVKLKSAKKAKKSFTAKWKKLSKKQQKKVKGIEIEYSLTPDFQSPLFKTAGKKKTSVKIKKLQSKKTYYVRSHTYVIRNGQKYVSYWSTAKKVKVK